MNTPKWIGWVIIAGLLAGGAYLVFTMEAAARLLT